ncbi:MAG: hypothetical protein SF339_29180 [Blastocatellia bacterium]|nr:hypothetical protein [Blastocatellia bacterium]
MTLLRWLRTAAMLSLLCAVALPVAGRLSARAAQTEAYFVIDIPPRRDLFVIKLTDPAKIQHARAVLSSSQTGGRQVIGRIVKQPVEYNRPWSFHLDPESINFFDSAVEVCDASVAYVESHLDEAGGAFLPGNTWCPWASRLVREIPAPVGGNDATSVSAASYRRLGLSDEAIIAAYGANLATATAAAERLPLPTTLAGTTVTITDALGIERLAPLFFVSPGQINYLVPPGLEPGLATIAIANANGAIARERTQLMTIAPALFTANADGKGVPAALIVRLGHGGAVTYEPVSRFDPTENRHLPIEINLEAKEDQVFLVLFGSGFRRSSLRSMDATIGGIETQVMFAGANPQLAGVDQINLQLPSDLRARGEVPLLLHVDDRLANPVTLKFK